MSLTNPYNQQNSPAAPAKLTPLLYTDAFTGAFSAVAIYASLYEGNIQFLSSANIADVGFTFQYKDVYGYDYTAYAAGTLGVYTINFSAVTVVANSQYNIIVNSGNGALAGSGLGVGTNVVFSTPTATTAALAASFLASLSGLINGGYLTATISGSTVTITEASLVTNGFSFYPSDANIAVATSTAHVNSSGTPSEVALYVPTITTGTYDKFVWKKKKNVDQSNGVLGDQFEYIVIWGDTSQSNYTNFKNTMNSFNNSASWVPSSYSQLAMQDLLGFPQ